MSSLTDWLHGQMGCECHGWLDPNSKGELSATALVWESARADACKTHVGLDKSLDGPRCVCRLAGKRAPEMACGQLQVVFTELAEVAFADIMRDCAKLPSADRANIVEEFMQAKGHCFLVLSNKLAPWSQLPWRLCALAHHNESTATTAAKDILEQFNRSCTQFVHCCCARACHRCPFRGKLLGSWGRGGQDSFPHPFPAGLQREPITTGTGRLSTRGFGGGMGRGQQWACHHNLALCMQTCKQVATRRAPAPPADVEVPRSWLRATPDAGAVCRWYVFEADARFDA